jgi:hypothetical protein
MKNLSTQCADKMMEKGKNNNDREDKPCRQTLNFLSQFARVYHADPAIRQELCGVVLN